ncbi:hypothetical protein ACH5RR_017779 [Cinchona calisaya]|uniref:Uncharacterized protein n=1 Tax=Cinchona calisaya TaxID=153742 RepID=A0ABD2ZN71_9GENT
MGRSPCCDKNGLKKGPWTQEEDQKLIDYIQKNGCGNWRTLPKNAGLQRCGKSCRLRWTNYLRPDIKRGRFSFEEEETIIQLHRILGNKWSAIAARLPGRTDNEIKNYWNTHIRKRLLRMGIDPITHTPRLDLLDFSTILNSANFYNPSSSHDQINISRLLGVQPLINPELLRLATSLFSSQKKNQDFSLQNDVQENLFYNTNPTCNNLSSTCTTLSTTPSCVTFPSDQEQLMQPNVDQFSTENISDFISSQSCELNDWQNNGILPPNFSEDYYVPEQNYYGHQSIFDSTPSDHTTSTFDQSNNNFSFQSVLSTPSSSPTPLHSNSTTTYINNSSSTCTTEDERESYCSNIMKFEIPSDFLDVNQFM